MPKEDGDVAIISSKLDVAVIRKQRSVCQLLMQDVSK